MSKSKKIGHFFTCVLKSVRDCKIERTGIGIGKARRMGRIAERVARTDAAHALRLVSAVNDVAVTQQIAQDQRRRQPRTVEPEGFEKRGVEGKGVAEPLLAKWKKVKTSWSLRISLYSGAIGSLTLTIISARA